MKKILSIIDLPDNLIAIKEIIKSYFPYCISLQASDGPEGISKAAEIQPELILIDMIMPGADGFLVCKLLKDSPITAHIPVIVLNMAPDTENRISTLVTGADALISKPYDIPELVARMKGLLQISDTGEKRIHKKNRIEQTVQTRTAELQLVNERLKKEIEQRIGIQAKLSDSKELLETIIKTSLDGYWLADVQGNLLEVNETYCRMTGYSEKELLQMCIYDIEAKEPNEGMASQIDVVIAQGETRFETQHCRKNGSIFDVEISVQYQPVEGGRLVAFIKDITDRNKAKEALIEKENRYRTLFEVSPSGILLIDLDGQIIDVNDSFCKSLLYEKHELIGQNIRLLVDPANFDTIPVHINEMVQGRVLRSVVKNIKKDGTLCDVELQESLIILPDGRKGILSAANNITERKQAETDLRNSYEQYRMLLDLAPDAFFQGDTEGNFITVNKAAEELSGYSHEELQKMNISDLFTNRQLEANPLNYQALISGEKVKTIREIIKKDGQSLVVEMNSKKMTDGTYQSFFRDITERRKAEDEMMKGRERAKLQRNAIARIALNEVITLGDLPGTFQMLTQEMSDTLNVERSGIWLFDENNTELQCASLFDGKTRQHVQGSSFKMADFPRYFNAIKNESRVFTSDAQNDLRTSEFTTKFFKPLGVTSLLDASIHIEGELMGVVCFEHCGNNRDWYTDEESFASTIASIVAQSLINHKRLQVEEELMNKERTHRTLLNNLPGFAYRCKNDKNWTMLYVSSGCVNITGYNPDDLIDNSLLAFNDIIHPDYREKIWIMWQHMLSELSVFEYEYPIIDKNGQEKWVWERGCGIFSEQGELMFIEGFITDITDKKQAEQSMHESELRFKQLFDELGDAVFVTKISGTDNGMILEVNPAAEKQTGYSRAELLNKNIITDIGISATSEIGIENWTINLLKGEKVNVIEKKRKKDGTEYWTEVVVTPIEYKGMKASLSINHDITDRIRAEQIQKVIYNISRAVTTTVNFKDFISLIRDELQTIIDAKNFYIAFYDDKKDELSFPVYFDEKDHYTNSPAPLTLSKYVIESKKPLMANSAIKDKLVAEGKLIYIGSRSKVWLGVPLKIEGRVTGVLVLQSYTDEDAFSKSDMVMLEFVASQIGISIERKKSEDDLMIALDKAEESDRLKSAFLANMSHEIRTPMNGILGFAQMLKRPGLNDDNQKKYIEIIEKSGRRMLNIINDIVDISRIEAGQMNVYISEANIYDQMVEIYTFFKPETDAKGIRLSMDTHHLNQDLNANTDREKLFAILTNLVKNAIKYTNEGSIVLGATKQGNYLKFYVKDTGIGVPQERQEAIFERFIQADIADTKAYEGAGLGLAITTAYIKLLGGKIWMESPPTGEQVGSVFYFILPMDSSVEDIQNVSETTTVEKDEPPSKTKGIILVVEDDETSVELISIFLDKYNVEFLFAKTGKEAVRICRQRPDIDLILMDIKLPEMNGYDATKQIRKFNSHVIIIAQTAFSLSGDKEKALDAGCNDYITKPLKRNVLTEMIEKYLNH
ncbi:MAG: PAS domain S-box protein [Bacteroidales bacterium]|nr:PAS domain S-box protein [Bacteroidales bacterium]